MSLKYQPQVAMTQKSLSFRGSYRVIIKPYDKACTCPVCDAVLKDAEDLDTFFSYGACFSCTDIYYYSNADAWNDGWRPNLKGDKNDI